MKKQLLRNVVVQQHVGLSRSEIYRLVSLGKFPKPIRLGQRIVAWDSDEVQNWIKEKIHAGVSK